MSRKEWTVQWRPGGVLTEPWSENYPLRVFETRTEANLELKIRQGSDNARYCDYRVVKRRVSAWKEPKS